MMERPNLVWGTVNVCRMGSYEYGSDTLMLSRILADDTNLLDYVMYHELLHKKHKFSSKHGRAIHHSKAFRIDEQKFKDAPLLEKRLGQLTRRSRIQKKKTGILNWLRTAFN